MFKSLLFVGGDGDSKDVKRLKSSVEIDGITVRWEWEGDGGKWTSYAPSHNEAITEAFNDEQKEVGAWSKPAGHLGVFLDTQTLKKHPSRHPNIFVRNFFKCQSQAYKLNIFISI